MSRSSASTDDETEPSPLLPPSPSSGEEQQDHPSSDDGTFIANPKESTDAAAEGTNGAKGSLLEPIRLDCCGGLLAGVDDKGRLGGDNAIFDRSLLSSS